ncbi:MAG TPA: nucleoside hydrolase [Candidatus Didemnitutus sp.]|nr:nucleoside hydrolase [Candidatus Didemnitutus sp.]
MSSGRSRGFRYWCVLAAACALAAPVPAQSTERWDPVPVIFDTDIGTDIDDVYALALIIKSPELKLLGVTTVAGDTVARARLAAKLLSTAGGRWANVPVYAGTATAPQYLAQCDWAKGFSSPALHESGGVEFMRAQIDAHPGEITIIAVGELTNVAALLAAEPGIAAKIKAIALMGGSIKRGYAPNSPPEAEWNIKSNAAAARAVFTSGVPLLVAPLDSTADLDLTAAARVKIFSHASPLNDAVAALDFIWTNTNTWNAKSPTLFDPLAVRLVNSPNPPPLVPLAIEVDDVGMTKPVDGRKPNAQVAMKVDPAQFLDYFVGRLADAPAPAAR